MDANVRVEFAGAIYHICNCFEAQQGDSIGLRKAFVRSLGETCEKFHWQCFSYCCSPRQYQLLLKTSEANLRRGMRFFNAQLAYRALKKRIPRRKLASLVFSSN